MTMEKAQFKSYQFLNHVEFTFLSPYRLKGFKSLQVVLAVLKKTLVGAMFLCPGPVLKLQRGRLAIGDCHVEWPW